MSCTAGKNGVLKAGGTAIAQLTSYSISETADTTECTHFDSLSYREHAVTFKSWDGSADLVWARQDGDIVVGNTYVLDVFPEGDSTATDWKISGTVIITSFALTGATEDNVSGSIAFQGTGVLTRGIEA